MKKDFSSKFTNANNQLLTASLFFELCRDKGWDTKTAIFSFQSNREGLVNARKTFIEEQDVTGFLWAKKYLANFDHFKRIKDAAWFKPHLEEWIEEIEQGLMSTAVKEIRNIANDETQTAAARLAANKYLAEQGWRKSSSSSSSGRGRGRPSKEEVTAETKRMARQQAQEDEDAARIGIKLKERKEKDASSNKTIH